MHSFSSLKCLDGQEKGGEEWGVGMPSKYRKTYLFLSLKKSKACNYCYSSEVIKLAVSQYKRNSDSALVFIRGS